MKGTSNNMMELPPGLTDINTDMMKKVTVEYFCIVKYDNVSIILKGTLF